MSSQEIAVKLAAHAEREAATTALVARTGWTIAHARVALQNGAAR